MFDAVQFCTDYNIDYSITGKNVSTGWIGINDIYASFDTTHHMGINLEGGYCYSWKTGWHSLSEVISDLLHISSIDAYKLIDDYTGLVDTTLQIKHKSFDISTHSTTATIRNFLRRRRYNAKHLIEKYDLRGDVSGHKLVIPIYFKKAIVSYQERDVYKKFYKACEKNKAIINYKDIVYPLDFCTKQYIVVTEGIFDAFRLGDNAVCTFGTSWTRKQLNVLSQFKYVVMLYDNEVEAQRKAYKMAVELSMMGCIVEISDYLKQCTVNDPDELTDWQAERFMQYLDIIYKE